MDMIDVATNDLEALAWQISPLFVVLSLVLGGFSFYVMPHIAAKLEGLATSHPKQYFVWCGGAGRGAGLPALAGGPGGGCQPPQQPAAPHARPQRR